MPSGVVLYFLVSNAWQIGQQALIFRTMPSPRRWRRRRGAGVGFGAPPDGKDREAGKPKAEDTPEPPPEGRFKRHWARPGRPASPVRQSGGNGDGQAKPGRSGPTAGGGRPGGDRVAGPGPTVRLPTPTQEAPSVVDRGNTPMEWIVTTGKTVAEAVEAALDELGVDEADIEYEVVEESKRGFLSRLGGGSPARIRARVKPLSREKPDRRRRGGGRERDREGAGGWRTAPGPARGPSGRVRRRAPGR